MNLLLLRSHQTEVIIVKRLIQECNNVTRVRVEPRSSVFPLSCARVRADSDFRDCAPEMETGRVEILRPTGQAG